MKTKAFSDMGFSLSHRHGSERNFVKEDRTGHTDNKLVISPIKAVWKYSHLISERKAEFH